MGMGDKMREKMRARARPFLEPDEPIDAVIAAQTRSFYLALAFFAVAVVPGVLLFLLINRYRMIVVTPRRIVVLDSGRWNGTKPKSVVAELPRTPLGPPNGKLWHKVQVGDETLRVARAYFKDIVAAGAHDAAVTPRNTDL